MSHQPPYGSPCQMFTTLKRTCRQCDNPESVTVEFAGMDSYDLCLAELGGDSFLCGQCLTASETAPCSALPSHEDQPWQPHYQDGERSYTKTAAVGYED